MKDELSEEHHHKNLWHLWQTIRIRAIRVIRGEKTNLCELYALCSMLYILRALCAIRGEK
ncbi:hypothetical protein SE18_03300 [Herpetosiphon geysericola]|uniref:Uncharacterized protein n=1 Tax=Herpetosiphon geysericola TaxID=70996 RepID=A0A0P6Z1U5_9CHLR|nr:hypothetical protein SE18_03300 [Herpetosiphon geysericola]